MTNIPKKYTIKIPSDNVILYCRKKKIITIIGPLAKKSLKLKLHLEIAQTEKLIKVTSTPFSKLPNNQRKQIKALRATSVALIKQLLIETSSILYAKLNFVGVGYRAFGVDNFEKELLMFKVGYSHPLYFKIPKGLNIFCLKFTKLFISGSSYQDLSQTAALIQSYKSPEPYKGKGILYENQKIELKEGKKV